MAHVKARDPPPEKPTPTALAFGSGRTAAERAVAVDPSHLDAARSLTSSMSQDDRLPLATQQGALQLLSPTGRQPRDPGAAHHSHTYMSVKSVYSAICASPGAARRMKAQVRVRHAGPGVRDVRAGQVNYIC